MRYLDRLQPLALLMLRLVLGVVMVVQGYPKILGHHAQYAGLPGWWSYASAAAEFIGGLLVLAGLFTRISALAICIDLGVTLWKVYWRTGFAANAGYQLSLALAAIAFALIFYGAGPIALDGIRRGGGGGSKPAKQ